jgi:hypothetical protein
MQKFRMFVCPIPEIEMGMTPTDKYFDTYEECLSFVQNELDIWKIDHEENNEFYGEEIKVVFLQTF